ncbi:MAG TPA: hypothetical protein VMN81_07230 [Vicinamibacterales bacterium]|nr:hypothetical protein [Vicinamibacterales bacterium]
MKLFKMMLGASALALLVGSGAALAHPDHRILGTVSKVTAAEAVVKDRDGKEHTIRLVKTTRVTRNRKPIKAADIPTGARVVITVVSDEDLTAKTIEVGVVVDGKL